MTLLKQLFSLFINQIPMKSSEKSILKCMPSKAHLISRVFLTSVLWVWSTMAREVYLFLLLFCGRTISESQPLPQLPSETLDFGYVPHKIYNTNTYYEPGTIGILFRIVHTFLCMVQPNYFPQGRYILNINLALKNTRRSFLRWQFCKAV